MFAKGKIREFLNFLNAFTEFGEILTLPIELYDSVAEAKVRYGLDFDDAYHFSLAKNFGLKFATMDSDFKKVVGEVEIIFVSELNSNETS